MITGFVLCTNTNIECWTIFLSSNRILKVSNVLLYCAVERKTDTVFKDVFTEWSQRKVKALETPKKRERTLNAAEDLLRRISHHSIMIRFARQHRLDERSHLQSTLSRSQILGLSTCQSVNSSKSGKTNSKMLEEKWRNNQDRTFRPPSASCVPQLPDLSW